MQSASPRDNEAESLSALHALKVLDSGPEEEFDALVRCAALICDVPVSLISLIDADRQWFKANIGLDGVTQTPREMAFCAHAVLGDALFEVPDAALDPRFADNPLVVGDEKIRFYAGAPVRLKDGCVIGTLCIIDRQPRELSDLQREALKCLAVAAARALEGRHASQVLQEVTNASQERLRRLYEATPAMLHSIDATGRLIAVSDLWLSKLGYTRDEVMGRPSTEFLSQASQEFAKAVVLPAFFSTGRCDNVEYQLVKRGGELLDVLLSAVLERDASGLPSSAKPSAT
jgi:diguanylate cyclase